MFVEPLLYARPSSKYRGLNNEQKRQEHLSWWDRATDTINEVQSTLEDDRCDGESKAEEAEWQCGGPHLMECSVEACLRQRGWSRDFRRHRSERRHLGRRRLGRWTCWRRALRGRALAHSSSREEAVVAEWGGREEEK